MSRYEKEFFTLTVDEAAQSNNYDIIIIGSGIGGGVLANDLYDTNLKVGTQKAKRILLLERGGLVFHSHSLNTARPTGDRGRQNDAMFAKFRDKYKFSGSQDPPDYWDGGPMYCLGGRSAAWGLFVPRIHDSILNDRFHDKVRTDLSNIYYDKAERLMMLSLPTTRPIHQRIMDRLNISGLAAEKDSQVQWKWGRIASEFADPSNFDFAQGAYSSIDKILEISMSQKIQDNQYFKTVLNAEVRSFGFRAADKSVETILVQKPGGGTATITVKPDTKVILCAGSVNSPAILMRSGEHWQRDLVNEANGGLRLTDHDVYFYDNSFRYSDPKHRDEYGAMKLQTYTHLEPGAPNQGVPPMALANISIDASSFLGRRGAPDDTLPRFFMVFLLQSKLKQSNTIVLDGNEPKITLTRGDEPDNTQVNRMKNLTKAAMESLTESAKLQFVKPTADPDLGPIKLGSVAHELGTLPMMGKDVAGPYCLDENLCMRPELAKDLYVCDLSCFPYACESNPTLTLAALAIRLSRTLHPRVSSFSVGPEDVKVINHSEAKIKVWLADHRNGEALKELDSGDEHTYTQVGKDSRCLLVHRTDPVTNDWTKDPIPMIIFPGKANAIQRDRVLVIDKNEPGL